MTTKLQALIKGILNGHILLGDGISRVSKLLREDEDSYETVFGCFVVYKCLSEQISSQNFALIKEISYFVDKTYEETVSSPHKFKDEGNRKSFGNMRDLFDVKRRSFQYLYDSFKENRSSPRQNIPKRNKQDYFSKRECVHCYGTGKYGCPNCGRAGCHKCRFMKEITCPFCGGKGYL